MALRRGRLRRAHSSCAPQPRKNRGLALIAALAIVLLASLYATLSYLRVAAPPQREALSREALKEAKAALIAFAADNRHRPGGLPCPDRDGDGEAELQCDSPSQRVGLLPWQTLKTGDLRDAAGEPLWYAVSAGFRNDATIAINSLTAGSMSLVGADRGAEEQALVAVIIAPGRALPGQRRADRRSSQRASFLEAENAVETTKFRNFTGDDAGNDRAEALTTRELFAVVDRVVAARIRREIVPILLTRYVDVWERFPYAVPFEEPSRSTLVDVARAREHRGLLPANTAPAWVQWEPKTLDVRQAGGAGRITAVDCSRTIGAEIRCTIDYAGTVDVAVDAIAANVGYALVQPPSTDDADFGPAALTAKRIHVEPIAANGSARIFAYARLPATSNRVRLHLRAPVPIPELTDPRLPVSDPAAWFTRNEWYRAVYLVVARGQAGSGDGTNCAVAGDCLLVHGGDQRVRGPAALVFMGRAREVIVGAPLLHRYLEGENRDAGGVMLWSPPSIEAGNDSATVLCPGGYRGCGERA